MGSHDISVGGREWRKWCAQADESQFTRRFIRGERRAKRDRQIPKACDE